MIGKFLSAAVATALCILFMTESVLAERVKVSRKDCQAVVRYVPDPGVTYQPGVDAHGNPVAPADLPGSTMQAIVPKTVEFDVSFYPLAGRGPGRFSGSELYVGTVHYDLGTGEILFNGVPLTDPQKDELAQRCREALRRR